MPVRFLPKLINQLGYYALHGEPDKARTSMDAPPGTNSSKELLKGLEDPNTKRILFDTRQAALFSELDKVPEDIQARIKTPFETFYLEFTEPVMVGEQEPGYGADFIRGILIASDVMKASKQSRNKIELLSLSHVTVFLTTINEVQYIDRSWKLDIPSGRVFVTAKSASSNPDPSEMPEKVAKSNTFIEAYSLLRPSLDLENRRYIGWWERITTHYSAFISWILVYMMAKGISIQEQAMTKKERKKLERNKQSVQPWHVIVVEPQITHSGVVSSEGTKHSYRYDVMGHLRFGKHRIKTTEGWSYRRVVEWVPPHQRGLQHSKYIPALRRYKEGKAIHPVFKEYLEGKEK